MGGGRVRDGGGASPGHRIAGGEHPDAVADAADLGPAAAANPDAGAHTDATVFGTGHAGRTVNGEAAGAWRPDARRGGADVHAVRPAGTRADAKTVSPRSTGMYSDSGMAASIGGRTRKDGRASQAAPGEPRLADQDAVHRSR